MESMLTLLSLAQFLALKFSEMDYFLKVLLNMVRDLSVSVSLSLSLLNYTGSHNLKSSYENSMMKC